jgi:hypothetical protein
MGGPELEEAMKTIRSWWSAPVLALVLAGAAHATTLFSQTLRVAPGDLPACNIVNAGPKEIAVKFELLNVNGEVAREDELSVLPGGANGKSFNGITGNFHCRFSGAFSKRDVRASMDVLSAPEFGTIVTAPAQ